MLPTIVETTAEVMAVDLQQVTASTGAELLYDASDPWAVTLIVHTGSRGRVHWMFARSLLTDAVVAGGAYGRVGDGDVGIMVRGSHVLLELTSPSGRAILRLPRADVDRLLDEAEQLVPEGSETVDWRRELALLAGEDA
ncbi:SsgA family sporulation/cell division regulator [Amycolatopsis orientalis]|uniref:SsgA family sporulation/cell division regulator n=1 Tax=Amycolatopsis orientalis TaxID=31958 RepID=UPI000419FA2A|nr:SsgA family sporulation/cell division regulator [Amycolatopsis orientalis]